MKRASRIKQVSKERCRVVVSQSVVTNADPGHKTKSAQYKVNKMNIKTRNISGSTGNQTN